MDFFEPKEVVISNRKVRVEASYRMYGFKDIMIKGGSFYAVWDEEQGLWSKDRGDAIRLIDKELYSYALEHKWDVYKDEPCQDAGSMCIVLRKIVNSDKSREWVLYDIYEKHKKAITSSRWLNQRQPIKRQQLD